MDLFIDATKPNELSLNLIKNNKTIKNRKYWQSFGEGEKILQRLVDFLTVKNISALSGIIVNIGPGPFTSLRLAVIAANTWAYALSLRLFGIKKNQKKNWQQIKQTAKPVKTNILLPFYGVEPKITVSKKKYV